MARAPAMNQMARTASKIMQPNEDVGMNGQMGLPHMWCAISQKECISQAMPMTRYDRKPTNANVVAMLDITIPKHQTQPLAYRRAFSRPSASLHPQPSFHEGGRDQTKG